MLSLKHTKEPLLLNNFTQLVTRGDGDCAIHAILGQWNGNEVACEDIEGKREALKKTLQAQPVDSALEPLLQIAVKELVMSQQNLNGFYYVKALRKQYQLFLSNEETADQSLWQTFDLKLAENGKEIVEYINNNHKLKCTSSNLI